MADEFIFVMDLEDDSEREADQNGEGEKDSASK